MAQVDLISEISPFDLYEFKRDFLQMLKVAKEMDRYYYEGQQMMDRYIPKFEKLIEQFNRKYKGLKLQTKEKLESYNVRSFVEEKTIKDFFANSASKIPGLKSIGRTSFNQADTYDMEKFASFIDTLNDKIFISYSDNGGSSSIIAALDRKKKIVEIIYDPNEISNENSSSFKICAYYALKDGFDKEIDVYNEASTFGFFNLLDELEKREWYDRIGKK